MSAWVFLLSVVAGAGSVAHLLGLCHLPTYLALLLPLVFIRTFLLMDCDFVLKFYEVFGKPPETLRGQVVWVTGASSGIGAALSVRLARAGAKVVLSARSAEKLNNVKKQCLETSGVREEDVLVVPIDLVQYDQHQPAFDRVLKHFGELHVLVNNAGRSQRGRWEEIQVGVDKELFDLDVFSTVALSRIVCKYFLEQGRPGHIATTSSIAGKGGVPFSASYTGAKHALQGYFECLRTEKIGQRLTITMACVGPTESNLGPSCFTENTGESLGKKRTGKMMSAERCAELFAVALANRVSEPWISVQPPLVLLYFLQYLPTISRSVVEMLPLSVIVKLRDGKSDLATSERK